MPGSRGAGIWFLETLCAHRPSVLSNWVLGFMIPIVLTQSDHRNLGELKQNNNRLSVLPGTLSAQWNWGAWDIRSYQGTRAQANARRSSITGTICPGHEAYSGRRSVKCKNLGHWVPSGTAQRPCTHWRLRALQAHFATKVPGPCDNTCSILRTRDQVAKGEQGPPKENISEERPSAQEDYGAEEQKHNCKSRSPQPVWCKIQRLYTYSTLQ